MNVLVRKNNQERGPYTETELRERLKSGALSGSDLGQVEGESEWKPLSEILLASVLATDNRTATPSPGRDLTANYPWLRDPKIIGGVVLLLLLILGGINWLNKASEKRRENAIAARQATAMEQAEKQAAAMLQKEQERAAQARQAQLDQVKQMMTYSEKAQKDYQERQKREQEERQKAEQAKIDAAQRQKQDEAKQADQRRLAAEAKQKAQEELLKNRAKPVATAANTNAPTGPPPTITLTSMPLGPIPKEREKMVISDDLARVFVIGAQGSRVQAIIDGVPGPLCRKLRWPWQRESLSAASYGAGVNPWGDKGPMPGPPPFSPDKKRVAYITELDDGKEAVIVDSVQSPVYDKIGWLAFGPNGHHLAYIAITNKSEVKGTRRSSILTMVDNGKAGPTFDDISSAAFKTSLEEFEKASIVFSADGEHLAYIGTRNSPQRNHSRVVIDGRAEPREYEHISGIQISRDGSHFAYITHTYIRNNLGGGTDQYNVVADSKEGPAFPLIEKLVLSEDGSRYAYVARGNKTDEPSAIVDKGVKGPAFPNIGNIVVSANGQRLAYIASVDKGSAVVIDNGKQSVPYDGCGLLSVSSDGSIVSFVAESSQGKLLVVNGQEFGPFYGVHDNLTYSSDGKHWACSVEATNSSGSGQFLTDGETFPVPNDARGLCRFVYRPDKGWFAKTDQCELEIKTVTPDAKVPAKIGYSRDGKHIAKIFASGRGSSSATDTVTLDDKPIGQPYYTVTSAQLSDDGKHVAFIGGPGGSAKVTYDGEEGPEHSEIYDLAMSPDGKHIAYSAKDGSGDKAMWHVVIDGFAGPDFDYQINYHLASNKFNPDGSLTFIAGLKGQLARYTYSAEALKFMPTIGQAEHVTPGTRVLQRFGSSYVSRHIAVTSNGIICGTVANGGDYSHGFFFRMKSDGTAGKIIHSFYGNDEDGNLDAGAYGEVFLGSNGLVYGQAGTVIFRYDLNKDEYAVIAKGHDSKVRLRAVLEDGSLLFEEGDDLGLMQKGSSDVQEIGKPQQDTKFVAVGPDGAIYSVTNDSLVRQSTVYSPPTVLHKFVDSPQDAKRPDQYVTFDPTGVVYGSARSGDGRRSIIYRVNRDGSDYRVLLNQSQKFHVSSVVAGDDGALYGFLAQEKQSGLCRLSTQGGQPQFLDIKGDSGQFQDGSYADNLRPMAFHNSALYHTTQDTLVKVQLPRTGEAARLNPIVTIKTVAAAPLTSAEPISFTSSSGEVRPTVNAPDAQRNATGWQPPAPGSTIATISKPTPPRGQNQLTSSTGANPPNTNFGNEAFSIGGLSQQDASQFAMNTVNAMSAGDVNILASFYGSQVDYQDKGIITNDALQGEFQQYFARWPQTNWHLAGTVTVQALERSRCQITFPVSFEAANPSTNKRSTGIARETMILEQEENGAWKIVRERQTITSRKAEDRGRRSEREKVYEGKPIDHRNLPIPPGIPWPPNLPHP